ncbi:MAG: ATP phosphoribosyltransferase regulatory subunit, partial [Selenomonadales bacterium]|nr:ATP phosphoribosyltransferase regulatory subunit [Selenomonadales bacterium]
ALTVGAPEIADCLCDDCQTHFTAVQQILTAAEVPFILNPRLVRGLDYYTKTAFEVQYAPLGAQSAVCGGGRYDGLVEECGGKPTPGIGFAIGIERVLLALEKQDLLPKNEPSLDAFVMLLQKGAEVEGMKVVTALRKNGFSAEIDFAGRSLKAQMKQANRQNARYSILLGEDEIKNNIVTIKNMQTGEQKQGTIEDMLTSMKSED